MKFCTADAGILLLALSLSLSLYTSKVFAQTTISDTVKVNQEFDFESVFTRLTKLSEIPAPFVEEDSLGRRIKKKVVRDLMNTHGHIDLGYAYGLNTIFIDTSRSIGSIFNTSGDFSTAIVGLPVNVSFNYSTLKVPLGTNNYFRISLDKNRLMEQQKQKLTASIADLEQQQASLKNKQAKLSGLMGYVEVYMDQLKRLAIKEASKRKQKYSTQLKDTLGALKPAISDSLAVKELKLNLENPVDYQLYYDSLQKIYSRITGLKNNLDSISEKLNSSKEALTSYQAQLSSPGLAGNAISKTGFLQSIRTFDIGLSYPKTTAISGQNVPIKGLHVEIQRKHYYLSVASGLTLNNLMLSTNEIQNKLTYDQNVFNNFDFQQVLNNGWLTAIKTGYGTPEGTHAFIGFNYLTNTRFLNPAGTLGQTAYDPAASFELDLRYVPRFLKGSAFDLVYGKTSLNKRLDTVSDAGVFESVFSAYQSHLLLTRYTQSLSRLRSDFSVSYRRIDPYVNPTTFGMMQPNNQRLEVKTNHRLAKFMKLGLLYRMEETLRPLSGMSDLRLNVTGATISGNYTSYFNYSLFVNHIHHRLVLPATGIVQNGNNYLVGASVASNYTISRTKASTMLSYNDYLLTDTAKVNKYTQFGFVQNFSEKAYSFAVSYDYFFKRIDSTASGTSVFGLAGKYKMKKVRLGAGLKLASDFAAANSLGGHIETLWEINKFLELSARAERFVLGNFYRNYYRAQYEQFPYLITLQTRFKI